MRRHRRHRGLRDARRQQRWSRHRRRLLPRHRGGDLQRSPRPSASTPPTRPPAGSVLGSREVDILARTTTWTMSRDTTLRPHLRRPRSTMTARASWSSKSDRHQLGSGSGRRHHLHRSRHHHRAQRRRLLRGQQPGVQPGHVRDPGRSLQGLRRRPLRRVHHRPFGARRQPPDCWPFRMITSCCRRSSPRSR